MKLLSKICVLITASLFISQAFAATISVRNTLDYNLDDFASHTIFTVPAEPNQPVYGWRIHVRFDGTLGDGGQTAKLIGHTNSQGILNIVVPRLPHWGSLCGFYVNERVAVGSTSAPKSAPLNFTVKDENGHVGPLHPPIGCESSLNIDNLK